MLLLSLGRLPLGHCRATWLCALTQTSTTLQCLVISLALVLALSFSFSRSPLLVLCTSHALHLDKEKKKTYILAEKRLVELYTSPDQYEIKGKCKGVELKGKRYTPLFPYFEKVLLVHHLNILSIVLIFIFLVGKCKGSLPSVGRQLRD